MKSIKLQVKKYKSKAWRKIKVRNAKHRKNELKMKKNNTIYTLAILLAMFMGMYSCTHEQPVQFENLDGKGVITFALPDVSGTPTTYATPAGDSPGTPTYINALAREKKVNSLHAVIFKNDLFVETIIPEATGSTGTYRIVLGDNPEPFVMYLLANATTETIAMVNALSATAGYVDFYKLVTTQVPGEGSDATNFIMISQRQTLTQAQVNSTVTDLGTVKLERLSPRFDFYNRVDGLKMQRVTMLNRHNTSRLSRADNATDMTGLTAGQKMYEVGQATQPGNNPGELIAHVYGYENFATDQAQKTSFKLEGTYKGQPVATTITLDDGPNIRPVRRNFLYAIMINPTGGEVDPNTGQPFTIDIVVNDWEVGDELRMGLQQNGILNNNDDLRAWEIIGADTIPVYPMANGLPRWNPNIINTKQVGGAQFILEVRSKTRMTPSIELIGGYISIPDGYEPTITLLKEEPMEGGENRLYTYKMVLPASPTPNKLIKFYCTFRSILAPETSYIQQFVRIGSEDAFKLTPTRKNPLVFIAEYNYNSTAPNGMAADHTRAATELFTAHTLKTMPVFNVNHPLSGQPTYSVHARYSMLQSVFPTALAIMFDNPDSNYKKVQETLSPGGVVLRAFGYYKYVSSEKAVYAYRYVPYDSEPAPRPLNDAGADYLLTGKYYSAWRYRLVPAPDGGDMIEVTAVLRPESETPDVNTLPGATFWDGPDSVTRYFPLVGGLSPGAVRRPGVTVPLPEIGAIYWGEHGQAVEERYIQQLMPMGIYYINSEYYGNTNYVQVFIPSIFDREATGAYRYIIIDNEEPTIY